MSVDLIATWRPVGSASNRGSGFGLGPVLLRWADGAVARHRLSGSDGIRLSGSDEAVFHDLWTRFIQGHSTTYLNHYFTGWAQVPQDQVERRIVQIPDINLAGASVGDADLRGVNLSHRDLTGINLQDACLDRANLSNCILMSADLGGASLHGADLSDAQLAFANLRGAELHDAVLRGADFTAANMDLASIVNCHTDGALNLWGEVQ